MKGLKFLVSCAAVAAVSAACATASFADICVDQTGLEADSDGTYGGSIAITGYEDYALTVGEGDLTLLVLNNDAETVGEGDIEQILQITQAEAANETGVLSAVKLAGLEAGTYYVRLGGAEATATNQNGFEATSFTVPTIKPDEPEKELFTKIIGDLNNDDNVDVLDLKEFLLFDGNMADISDIDYYVTGLAVAPDDDLTLNDVNAILLYEANMDSGLIWYEGDFYYDEATQQYLYEGELRY